MLILFGFKTSSRPLFAQPATCHFCGEHAAQRVVERVSKFTLFFIPLFTTRRRCEMTCTNCGTVSELSAQEKDAMRR